MLSPIGSGGELPLLLLSPKLPSGLLLALLAAIAVYLYTNRTAAGYELIAMGANPRAARVYGINVRRLFLLALWKPHCRPVCRLLHHRAGGPCNAR